MTKTEDAIRAAGPLVQVRFFPTRKGGKPLEGMGLIDTGASHTSIDIPSATMNGFSILHPAVESRNAGPESITVPVFVARLQIQGLPTYFKYLEAPGFYGAGMGEYGDNLLALIGRDILSEGSLFYNGKESTFTLELP